MGLANAPKLIRAALLYVFIFSFFSSLTVAQVDILAIDIPGLHEKGGKGIYSKVLNETVVKKGLATIKVTPPMRTEVAFSSCTNCCISPANKNPEFYDYPDSFAMSKPMSTAYVYVFTPAGSEPITSLDQLVGKKLGARNGMPYGKSFDDAKLNVSLVNNIEQNIKKLDNGRIDAFIAYAPDVFSAFEAMGKEPYSYAKDKPLSVHPDALVCQGVDASFIDTFNSMLDELEASGKLEAILNGS